MLTLSSPDSEILQTIRDERPRAIYWFNRQNGGESKVRELTQRNEARSVQERRTILSDVVEYKSKTGNRWRVFTISRYFESTHTSYTNVASFIYYDTFGSCGAFVPASNGGFGDADNCVIYTSHFFLRMCQRYGIPYRSSKMIDIFVEMVPMQVFRPKDTIRAGFQEVTVRISNAIGNGIIRRSDPFVCEIRSFLTTDELTPSQRNSIKDLLDATDNVEYEPESIAMQRILKSDNFAEDLIAHSKQTAKLNGFDEKVGEYVTATSTNIMLIFIKLGLVHERDFERICSISSAMSYDALDSSVRAVTNRPDWYNLTCEMLIIATDAAKTCRLKNFDSIEFVTYYDEIAIKSGMSYTRDFVDREIANYRLLIADWRKHNTRQ